MGAGKTLVCERLQEMGFSYASLSTIVTAAVAKLGVERSAGDRPIGQNVGNSMRRRHGNHVLALQMLQEIRGKGLRRVAVDGIRNPGEISYFRSSTKFVLLGITASPEVRYQRIAKRHRLTDPKTFADFIEVDKIDRGVGQPLYGQQVDLCLSSADFVIVNDSTEKELVRQLNDFILGTAFHDA